MKDIKWGWSIENINKVQDTFVLKLWVVERSKKWAKSIIHCKKQRDCKTKVLIKSNQFKIYQEEPLYNTKLVRTSNTLQDDK